jgi:adenine-specific DNA-methyltransferase
MNYIGSKYSLLEFIGGIISDVAGNPRGAVFADLFAGTGVVGSAFKKMGFKVIANDIQHYSYALNRHYVGNVPPIEPELLDYLNSLDGEDGFVYKNYCAGSGSGRNYFTDENGRKCDAIRGALDRLLKDGKIGEDEYYCYLAGLINSIDKVANTASVYGAYLKHIKSSAAKPFKLELLPLADGEKGDVYNEDINGLIRKINGDVLYLDPPYNARQYCSNYHVLETVSRYDNPVLSGVTGLRSDAALKSAYCSKRTVEKAFDDLIGNADFKYIFLSYNNEGLMSIDTIRRMMERYGEYEQHTLDGYPRFRADKENARRHKADTTTEYLHVLVK